MNEERFECYGWSFFKSYLNRYHMDLNIDYLEFSGNSKNGTQRIYGYDLAKKIFWCIYLDEFNSSELESTYRYLQSLSAQKFSFSKVYLFASQQKTPEAECLHLSEMIAHLAQDAFQFFLMGYRFCGTSQNKVIAMQEFILMPSVAEEELSPRKHSSKGGAGQKNHKNYSYADSARLSREEIRDFIDLELDYKMLNS